MIENEKGTEKYPQCPLSTNSERHARKLHFPIKLPLHAGNAGDADHPVRRAGQHLQPTKNAGTSCAKDDADRATVGFVVANAAIASDKKAIVFLSTEGTRLSQQGYADDIHEVGFAPAHGPDEELRRGPDDEAVKIARFLAFAVGRAHARQMDQTPTWSIAADTRRRRRDRRRGRAHAA